ncbi:hypothetical protein CHS0354_039815 [Potamilus streckersoni]|nr:hypothetical protein CHS0354_039815 [Potamilus streckersoni]
MLVTLVNKHFDQVGKQMQLREVLEKHKPPIMVKLTGLESSSTNRRFMKLLSVHHLVSMQGYFVNYGNVDPKQIEIPLYLSEMRLAPLTGIKGLSQTDFLKYCHNLKKGLSVETIIKRNRKRVVNVYRSATDGPEINYDVMEPMAIKTLADAFDISLFVSGDDKNNLSNAPPPLVPKRNQFVNEEATSAKERNIHIQNRPIPEIPPDYNLDNGTEPKDSGWSSMPNSSPMNTAVAGSHFKNISPISQTASPPALTQPHESHKTKSTFGRSAVTHMKSRPLPEIPKEVHNSISEHKPVRSGMLPQHSRNIAQNHVITGRSKHLETLSHFPEAGRSAAVTPVRYNNSDDKKRSHMPARSDHHNGLPVANFTVDDVSHWLWKLHLHEYIRKFKEQLIDGKLLCRLDERILIEDFNFSNTEAIRLMAFVREGHVPR